MGAHARVARHSSRTWVELRNVEGGAEAVVLVEPKMALVTVVTPYELPD